MLTILPRLSIGVVFGDAGSDVCCPDDRHCYIGTDWAVKCCGKGSICPNSPCAETQYYCNKTVVAEDGSLTYKADCCLRQCDQSTQFRCPDSLGGGCCDVGNECTIATGATHFESIYPSSILQRLVHKFMCLLNSPVVR